MIISSALDFQGSIVLTDLRCQADGLSGLFGLLGLSDLSGWSGSLGWLDWLVLLVFLAGLVREGSVKHFPLFFVCVDFMYFV
jgi:hypothetical protein